MNPPAVGPSLNFLTPARFDGVNDKLDSVLTEASFFAAGGGYMSFLFNPSAAAAPGAVGSNPALLSDTTNNFLSLEYSTLGVRANLFSGAFSSTPWIPAATGAWHRADARWDGVDLQIRVDGGPWSSVPAGALTALTGTPRFGASYNAALFFAGDIAAIMFFSRALSNAESDTVGDLFNALSGLSIG